MSDLSRRAALGLIVAPFAAGAANAMTRVRPATVMVVATLHQGHATDRNYSYADLDRLIVNFKPNWVGVEIRPEDMTADPAYVQCWYPQEMVTLKDRYGDHAFGFDWWGDDLAGQPIPADWRTSSSIQTLEAAADGAPELQAADKADIKAQLDAIRSRQNTLLSISNPRGLNDGRYDAVTVDYYDTLRRYYDGTRFADLCTFYTARDAHIAANIATFIKTHPGDRIAIVTGADHHGPVVRYIKDKMPDVKLQRVTQR
jgi:hypothetical protein